MALIKCPECTKEVSDRADKCIHCGYGIEDHIKRKEMEKEGENDSRYIDELRNRNLKKYEAEIRLETLMIEEMRMPEEPTIISTIFDGFMLTLIVVTIVFASLSLVTDAFELKILTYLILFATVSYFISRMLSELPNMNYNRKIYNEQINHEGGFQGYKKEKINQVIEKYATMEELEDIHYVTKSEQYQKSLPKCPMCQSTSIKRISTLDRGISLGMVGLASARIGKQYKCQSCNHLW